MQIFQKQRKSQITLTCIRHVGHSPPLPAKRVVIETDKNLGHNHFLYSEKKQAKLTTACIYRNSKLVFLCPINRPVLFLASLPMLHSQSRVLASRSDLV